MLPGTCLFASDESMMTSSIGKKSALLALFAGNSLVTGTFPSQRLVTRSFCVSLICAWTSGWVNSRNAVDLRRHRTSFWRHCNAIILHRKSMFLNIELETCVAPKSLSKSLFVFSNWSNEVNRKKSIAYLLIILKSHFQSIFLEKILVVMSSLKFVRRRSIYNMQALV